MIIDIKLRSFDGEFRVRESCIDGLQFIYYPKNMYFGYFYSVSGSTRIGVINELINFKR